jgi:hypothetical protein
MRKQNHSILQVLKHNSRLNNSVVRSRKYKRPNAQKAGVYTAPLILPGEDPREFEASHCFSSATTGKSLAIQSSRGFFLVIIDLTVGL